jgi:hypothetical protein
MPRHHLHRECGRKVTRSEKTPRHPRATGLDEGPHGASDTTTSTAARHTTSHTYMTQLRHGSTAGRTPPEGGRTATHQTTTHLGGRKPHLGCHIMAMEHASPMDKHPSRLTTGLGGHHLQKSPTAPPLVGSKPPPMAAICRLGRW